VANAIHDQSVVVLPEAQALRAVGHFIMFSIPRSTIKKIKNLVALE
jgi:hypothetical protein